MASWGRIVKQERGEGHTVIVRKEIEIERVKGMMTRQRMGEEAHRREARRWREIK